MSERELSPEAVREEHLDEVHVPAQWAYIAAVILGGGALMFLVMALLGGSG